MAQVKYDEVQVPGDMEVAVVTYKVGVVAKADNPYMTGVYVPGSEDQENPYQEIGSPTKEEAMAAHRKLMADWQNAQLGICITCGTKSYGELAWIVDDRHYCDDMGKNHEPQVCTECSEGEPCEKHPNFCNQCESSTKLCDTHQELNRELEDWEMEE